MSPLSMKSGVCVGYKINQIEQKKIHKKPTQIVSRGQNWKSWSVRVTIKSNQ